jgi:WD40 repeat protein/uncharacterized caspase-like protein
MRHLHLVLVFGTFSLLNAGHALGQQPTLSVQVGHTNHVRAIAFSPDGTLLASGGQDNAVIVWDSESGLELRALTGHSGAVNAVIFSPDGKTLASAGADRTTRLWNVDNGQLLRTLSGHDKSISALAFSPDGRSIISASDDSSIMVWDVASGKTRQTLTGHTREIYALALSADGRYLATGAYDRTLRIWDLASGKTLQVIAQRASSLALSADGRTLVSDGYRLMLWDMATGRALQTLDEYQKETTESRGAPVTHLTVARDGRLAELRGDNSMRVWDLQRGSMQPLRNFSNDLPMAMVFSPDGTQLAVGGYQNAVRLLSIPGGGQLRVFAGHANRMHAVSFSPDGRLLITGAFEAAEDSASKSWDLASTAPPRNLPGLQNSAANIAFNAAGTQLVSAGWGNSLLVRDVRGGRLLREIDSGAADRLSSSADGRMLATFGRDDNVSLWDTTSGRLLRKLPADSRAVHDIALSPNGRVLVTAGGERTIKVWNTDNGQLQRTINEEAASLAFSPGGRMLAFSGRDHGIALLNLPAGTPQRMTGMHENTVRRLAFSQDGRFIASAGADETVRIWNVATRQLERTLHGHSNEVYGVAFSPDGALLATASWDATVRLWQVATGTLVATLLAVDRNDWLVMTPEGMFDGSPGAWSKLLLRFSPKLWDVASLDLFFADFFHPGLLTELIAGRRPLPPRSLQQVDRRQPQLRLGFDIVGSRDSPDLRHMKIMVQVTAAPAGARDVRLFRNGTLVKVWRGDVLQGQSTARLETEITLVAGHNDLTAYAFNTDNVKSNDATLPLIADPVIRRAGITHVLAIGINAYANTQFDLRYAVADAEDFSGELQRQAATQSPGSQIEVTMLRDQQANKSAVLNAIAALAARSQPEDTVMLFFAGHGLASGDRFYLVPHDLGYHGDRQQLNEAALKIVLTHGISDRELESAVAGIDAAHLALIIDACQSGQALEAAERRRGPMNSTGLAQLAYEKGMYVLTAAQSYQAAQELSEFHHGLLTYALVEQGLKNRAADFAPHDGRIELREWFDYAVERVPQLQLERMRQAALRGIKLAYASGDEQIDQAEQRNIQRPRVFYRREVEADPFVVAGPTAAAAR